MTKLITREELNEAEVSNYDNFISIHEKACEIAEANDSELFNAICDNGNIKLKKLLKEGKKPSKQTIELFFYWLEDDVFNERRKIFKLLIEYGAYKLTLRELIKYGTQC